MDTFSTALEVEEISNRVIFPFLLTVGLLFNITVLCVWIFGQKSKQLCCATYFASNAAVDILCLLIPGLSMYLSELLWPSGQMFSNIFFYTRFWLLAISNWISVAITVERALTVLWPFVFKSQDMIRRSKYIVLAICVLITAIHVPINTFASDFTQKVVEGVVRMALPFFMIVTFNAVVIETLCRNKKQRHTVSPNHSRYVDVFTKITILTGLSFVVSNVLLVYVYIKWWTDRAVLLDDIWFRVIFGAIAPIMQFLNSVSNPVICFAVCKSVREDMWACACTVVKMCRCNKPEHVSETSYL